jgi:hypothetical protein
MSRAQPSAFKCSAVVSDVDGTLVTDDKHLTARARSNLRSACRADRRRGGSMKGLQRWESYRVFRGAAPIGSEETNTSCRTTIPTAITG